MKQHIPNFITCLNLLAGCIAIVFAFQHQLEITVYLLALSALFDFFDGLAARALNAYSVIGKDLDSLADMVSFGFAPGAIMYIVLNDLLLAQQLPTYWAYTAFIIPVFSALRLAKFNNDTRQSTYFVGLPTPANTLFFMSIPFVLAHSAISNTFINSPAFLISLIVLMSFFMVAEIPLISLKFKNFNWKENLEKFLLIGISIILFVILKFVAIPLIILCYILLSMVSKNKIIS